MFSFTQARIIGVFVFAATLVAAGAANAQGKGGKPGGGGGGTTPPACPTTSLGTATLYRNGSPVLPNASFEHTLCDAKGGDWIVLQAGTEYSASGGFRLPYKDPATHGSGWITVGQQQRPRGAELRSQLRSIARPRDANCPR